MKLALALLAVIVVSQISHARQQQSIEFVQQFREIQNDFTRERIYLHTDRNWYVHGDRIWLSAYITAGSLYRPSAISSVLYVELFDPEGSLVERVQLRIESGRATGSITFNNTDPRSGTYRLRAYTAWAKNFGDSYIHESDIAVLSEDGQENIADDESQSPDLQFFAEGGPFIAGLPQRIAFKAIGSDGLSRSVSGWLYTQDRSDSVRFESEFNGMGVIEEWVSDEAGAFAIAEIDGETIRETLPEPVSSGSYLNVDKNETNFLVSIQSNNSQAQSAQLLLFAHVRGEIYYASMVLMQEGIGNTTIPFDQFPTGIVHFTLLDTDGIPVSERLAFNKNSLDNVDTELQLDEDSYGLRDEAALTLVVADGENVLVPAETSLSVFDDTYANYRQYSTDIRSRLYLETEIRGHIEDPGYYFSNEPNADKYLDNLLLSQGWRSYDMQSVSDRSDINLFSLPEEGFSLTGTIKSGFRGRPLENATVAFSLENREGDMDIVTTGPDGKFMISGIDVEGAASFTLRANNENGSDRVQIELDNQFSNLENSISPPRRNLVELYFNESDTGTESTPQIAELDNLTERSRDARVRTDQFLEAQLYGELDEITVTAESERVDEQEQTRRIANRPSQRIDLDEKDNLSVLPIEIILNQIPGVSVIEKKIEINTGFMNFGGTSLPPPLILVDDVQTDVSFLLNMSPADIKTINVFRRAVELASFGVSGTGGVISVRTRRGDAGYAENERGTITGRLRGYQQPVQFYSPQYGVTVPRDIEEPDNRITLHWEGDLSIPETGGTLRFWTNDVPSRYRIVLQGITENGIPFSATRTFDVSD
ncbi:MAG: hypothetical protein R3283_02750 [Balneolaceae bacterium]|nr:hypothetical protein [Balneolaceae bacterium]